MRYLSVCSGIEAATVAWHPLGWTPVAFSEIEPFPCAVLAHHYPDVPNWGDMTKFQEWPDVQIDVLVGGTPCQSFSVAGLRQGLADPRGNLLLTYLAVARRYRPRWVAWENVPGVLSQDGGRAFGTFLGALGLLGYGFAYRVLDAQYFGLAQRRKRVFVVGHLGDWRRAAAVLFERASLSGHPAPRRETREAVAKSLRGRPNKSNREDSDTYIAALAPTLPGSGAGTGRTGNERTEAEFLVMAHGQGNAEVCEDGSPSLTCNHEAPILAHTLRAEHDASEDGTGRGTPLIAFDAWQSDVIQYGDQSGPLDTDGHSVAVAFHENQRAEVTMNDTVGSLKVGGGKPGQGYPAIHSGMQVRRLTPRECECLQGFPDDYTLIPYRNKPAADGPRYKALGNSMAVPVITGIGRRLQAVDRLRDPVAWARVV